MTYLSPAQLSKIKDIVRKSGVRDSATDSTEYVVFLILNELLERNIVLEKQLKTLESKVKDLKDLTGKLESSQTSSSSQIQRLLSKSGR